MLLSVYAVMDMTEIQKIESMDVNQNLARVKLIQTAHQIRTATDLFANQLALLTQSVHHQKLVSVVNASIHVICLKLAE